MQALTLFTAFTCSLWLTGSSRAVPSPPPPQPPQQPRQQQQLPPPPPLRGLPLPPPSPSPSPLHPIRVVTAHAQEHPASGSVQPVLVDGVPLDKVPPGLIVAAYLSEQRGGLLLSLEAAVTTGRPRMVRSATELDPISEQKGGLLLSLEAAMTTGRPRMLRSATELDPITEKRGGRLLPPEAAVTTGRPRMMRSATELDPTAYCTTEECVQMMQEYEEWRLANGYGTSGGRWG